ncbi:MAG: nucleotidyl transferase AbiEii/AbiGii toxin family protein [Vicingaceae bacterium]|nr:nucleotidyl transferase AbiEii/AbiGii toxin family protein [Vicingaceae bacterium]
MILKKEIEVKAETQNIPKSTIDKDWVLGHFIDAIFSIPECEESLIFKGGTCLRKCYFPNYRFSEDLDFTCTNPKFELTKKMLNQLVQILTERTEILLHIEELKPLLHKNKLMGYKAIIKFWGADHPRNQAPPPPERWTTSIKIEIILYELMVFPVETREVHHPYSDKFSQTPLEVPCYAIHEVLSEKLRALIQRSYTAPRDFFDIWYLANNVITIDWEKVTEAFHKKMKFKELEFTGVKQMINGENDKRLKAAWKNSLGHQIPEVQLPEYEVIKKELVELLNKIFM